MLKITESPNKLAFSRNNSNKSASSRNDDSKSAFGKNDGNGKINRFDISRNSVKYTKKSRKSKSEKPSKSRNLAKLEKKLSKNGNLTNFNATKAGPKFLTPNTRTAFNHL